MSDAVDEELLLQALEELRPYLLGDGGDMKFHGVNENGVVKIELLGACGTCPLSIVTLAAGIEQLVMARVPNVSGVISISPNLPVV